MAFTITREHTVFGNKKAVLMDVVADGAEANIDTGIAVITAFSIGVKSMAASTYTMHENVDSSGTASNGKIGVSGLTSGDDFHLIVYGR
jgi:hypothetical protein